MRMRVFWNAKYGGQHRLRVLHLYRIGLRASSKLPDIDLRRLAKDIFIGKFRKARSVHHPKKAGSLYRLGCEYVNKFQKTIRGTFPTEQLRKELQHRFSEYLLCTKQGGLDVTKFQKRGLRKTPLTEERVLEIQSKAGNRLMFDFVHTSSYATFLRPKYAKQSTRLSMSLKSKIRKTQEMRDSLDSLTQLLYHAKWEDAFESSLFQKRCTEEPTWSKEISASLVFIQYNLIVERKKQTRTWIQKRDIYEKLVSMVHRDC
ncbi:hypothetical protein SJAG_04240 [Schizosaccharomyces japonicus yFS275]|uniref:Complex 1 LYR protein domain-containing protein n=1 Tax=Schizosaccharomyces japonicus (strain yFS275 / FY16936) TaxID=402676 RepID=B6K6B2_SCHJY|nr:hypothetical protein SJAG_04240 [Schizosaccharomyces japonicus yFS275]EEB09066.2 hypothetical protein SJAG_04240 [Schizosaccharomyces japonicus yFS275]